jgi:hypothetical protein
MAFVVRANVSHAASKKMATLGAHQFLNPVTEHDARNGVGGCTASV